MRWRGALSKLPSPGAGTIAPTHQIDARRDLILPKFVLIQTNAQLARAVRKDSATDCDTDADEHYDKWDGLLT